jgi:hypothetical protein
MVLLKTSARQMPRLITSMHPMEQKAILAFTEQAVMHHGSRISSISLYGTGQRTSRGFEDIEILVLTPKEDGDLEDALLDTIAEIVVETGVYLTVKCFSQAQFKAFSRAGVPMMRRIMDNRISLFES